ncbi:phospholipase D family protein [Paraburkholderia bengalensis]|uniref:Phospholipase D family protein n=1 Tax=Paraburkholderia bengalensis TaxID=2747562 RepID=A0ABU8J1G9_9BURK
MSRLQYIVAAFLLSLLQACTSLPPQIARTPTYATEDTQASRLGLAFAPSDRTHPGSNAFHLLSDGIDALVARIMLIEMADETLDLQYYIWHDDLTGRELAASLLKAADRGVRVRVLLDDLGTNPNDRRLLALNSHQNIKIRLFNPAANRKFKTIGSSFEFARLNRRMHNKSLIADNQAAILGGRNIGDEYFGASSTVAFGDLDVLVHGPVVHDASHAFDEFWNSDVSYSIDQLTNDKVKPDDLTALRAVLATNKTAQQDVPYVARARDRLGRLIHSKDVEFTWGKARLLYDSPSKVTRAPDDTTGQLMSQMQSLDLQPSHEMLIVTPYFVPGERGVEWIRRLTERGVRVTVITNSLAATDVTAVHAGYQRYRKPLLAAGVRLYEMKPVITEQAKEANKSTFGSAKASLHAKTYAFDRSSIFIGSMNLDPRSVKLNTEIGLYCQSAGITEQVVDGIGAKLDSIAWRVDEREDENGKRRIVWIETADNGTETELDSEPGVSSLKRVGVWLLGLLPIESQL